MSNNGDNYNHYLEDTLVLYDLSPYVIFMNNLKFTYIYLLFHMNDFLLTVI